MSVAALLVVMTPGQARRRARHAFRPSRSLIPLVHATQTRERRGEQLFPSPGVDFRDAAVGITGGDGTEEYQAGSSR